MNYVGLTIHTPSGPQKVVAHDEPRYDRLGEPRKRVRFNAKVEDGSVHALETTSSSWVLRMTR